MCAGWNPFNKTYAPKRSIIPRTEESELKRSLRTAEELEESVLKLNKDAKKFTDMLFAISRTEMKISQDLSGSPLCAVEDEMRSKTGLWVQRLQRLDTVTQELNGNVQRMVVEPMKKYSSIFPTMQNAVKKREQCVQELNRCQAKMEKYQDRDKTGQNIVKLDMSKKGLFAAKEEYDAVNLPLQQDLPKLYLSRIHYMEPCLQGLVISQGRFFRQSHEAYSDIFDAMNADQDFLLDEKYHSRIQARLDEIRALSIVVE